MFRSAVRGALPAQPTRVVLVATALLAGGCVARSDAAGGADGVPVEVQTLVTTQLRDSSTYVATLNSRRSVVLQPLEEGRLTRILVTAGDVVEAGQVLMEIDRARQRAAVSSASATRASRVARLHYAEQAYKRNQLLYDGGAISRQELEQAHSAYLSAVAEVEALSSQIRLHRVELSYCRVTAPVAGVVGDLLVRVGDHVTANTKVTTLDENRVLEAYIGIPVERAAAVALSQPVEVTDLAGRKLADSRISFISPRVDGETQTVLLKVQVPNPTRTLRSSQSVRARVIWSSRDGVRVPSRGILRLNGQSFVFVAARGPKGLVAEQRPVSLGEPDADGYPVITGVKTGEAVIVAGVQKVQDGARVVVSAAKEESGG